MVTRADIFTCRHGRGSSYFEWMFHRRRIVLIDVFLFYKTTVIYNFEDSFQTRKPKLNIKLENVYSYERFHFTNLYIQDTEGEYQSIQERYYIKSTFKYYFIKYSQLLNFGLLLEVFYFVNCSITKRLKELFFVVSRLQL